MTVLYVISGWTFGALVIGPCLLCWAAMLLCAWLHDKAVRCKWLVKHWRGSSG